MQNAEEDCDCRVCEQPMKLIRRLPQIGHAPELLFFYCRECNEVDSAEWRSVPAQSAQTALN